MLAPPACTLINPSPPIQTGALADHCCDAACGLERLLEGDARKPRTLVGLQTLPWQQGREWDAGGRPRESWEKKDAAHKISADHLCKTNEGGETVIQPTILHQKNKALMLVFQLNMLQKLFILYSRTKPLQPHTFSVKLCIGLVCFLDKINIQLIHK